MSWTEVAEDNLNMRHRINGMECDRRQTIPWVETYPRYWVWRKNMMTGIGAWCLRTDDQEKALEFYQMLADNPKFDAALYDQGNLI
jgi:hypothetical protein